MCIWIQCRFVYVDNQMVANDPLNAKSYDCSVHFSLKFISLFKIQHMAMGKCLKRCLIRFYRSLYSYTLSIWTRRVLHTMIDENNILYFFLITFPHINELCFIVVYISHSLTLFLPRSRRLYWKIKKYIHTLGGKGNKSKKK